MLAAAPQDSGGQPGTTASDTPIDPCRSRSWDSTVGEFNKGLADAHMGLKVDSGGNFVNPDHRSLEDILTALGNNGWEQFSTNINPAHWGGIHLEGRTSRPPEKNYYSNKSGYDDGYWFHMIFYPAQKEVLGPRQIMYKRDDLSKPPAGFEMHCERGGLRPSSVAHGLDYLKEIFIR